MPMPSNCLTFSKETVEYLDECEVPLLEWPAYSPDLNPIENIWGIIGNKLRGHELKNKDELWKNVQNLWTQCYEQHSQKLADSLPTRVRVLIKVKGGHLKY